MGVFARFLRRSKTTEDASPAETRADAPAAEVTAEEKAEAKGPAGAGTKETAEPETAGSDGVEIPKQQSADGAVDNETDKGART
ncbi:hypothetical protein ACWD00_15555 [Streptomyces viridiviolaceus]